MKKDAQKYVSEKGREIAKIMVNLMREPPQKIIKPENQLNLKL